MTSNKEDYLKIIYEEGGMKKPVSNKIIAEKLNIAPPSVSEMLVKLSQQDLINYEAYKGSTLTEKGVETCINIVRSHRLWEVFLMNHLGYTWREAHEDAHLLEHIAPVRMLERLDSFLGFPKTCPHGSIIPQKGQQPNRTDFKKLSDLSIGDVVTIKRVEEDGKLLDYLERSHLKIHKKIKVLSIDDYEGPISFLQDGKNIAISYKAATKIYVEI